MELQFPYNKYLLDELKESTWKRQWNGDNKTWLLPDNLRNRRWVDYMQGINTYEVYDRELELPMDPIGADGTNKGVSLDPRWEYVKDIWTHQVRMFTHLTQRKHCIIAGEMRTGKTLPTLRAIQYVLDGLTCKRLPDGKNIQVRKLADHDIPVIVAPKSALKGMKKELSKWKFPYEVRLLTYEKFRDIFNEKEGVGTPTEIVPRIIVFDECQKLKNPSSNQGRIARNLSEAQIKKFGFDESYTWELSGTPSPKSPSDWWNIAEVAYHGFLREGNEPALKNRIANMEQREGQIGQRYWHLISWKEEEVEKLNRRLGGLVEVFLKKDCLDLPQKKYTVVNLDVHDMYCKAAAMLKKTVLQKAQLLNKLRQLSDGFIYQDGEYDEKKGTTARDVHYFPKCPKDEQLKSDLDEFEDVGRVVIYCGYQASMEKVTKLCIEKDWIVLQASGKGWKALNTTLDVDLLLSEMDGSSDRGLVDKIAFVAQADAASTGIELSASPVIIYYSNSFSGGARMQSEDRPYSNNMDKARGLEIRDYIHLPSDMLVRNNLLNKKDLQAITMGDLSKSLENILSDYVEHGRSKFH